MNQEELNIWIAEKLMGHNVRMSEWIVVTNEIMIFDDSWHPEAVPNYFAEVEGWEQAKRAVINQTGLHYREYSQKGLESSSWLKEVEEDHKIELIAEKIYECIEQARYEAFKQAQPEIERRLNAKTS